MMRRSIELVCLLWLCLVALPMSAQTQSSQVRKLNKQRNEVLRRIEATNKALKAIQQSSKEEHKRLDLVRQQVAQRREAIGLLEQEMRALEGQLDSLGGRISALRQSENKLQEQYARSLRALQQDEHAKQRLIFLLSAKDIDELRTRQTFMSRYALATSEAARRLRATRKDIEETQAAVATTQQQKAEVLSLRDRERKALEQEEGKRAAQVRDLKGQERKLSQDLDKQRRQANQLDAQIQAQIAAEIAAAEAKARRAQEAREARARRRAEAKRRAEERVRRNQNRGQSGGKTDSKQDPKETERQRAEERRQAEEDARRAREDSEAERQDEGQRRQSAIKGGYAMDANERKLSGSFAQNKGRLPMPVRGRYELVRRFGTQQHDLHSRVSISNGGVDLRVSGDRSAYAVFEGVVSRVFVTAGYGQSVIVRHGNYLTVYSNLSSVRVSSGQRVSAGTALGSISSDDSNGRGNTLHFQLWHERSKQNPAAWIRM